jgi:hypothetical protein
MVSTGMDTTSASYTQFMIDGYLFPRSIVAEFDRACGNTRVAIYAFFLVNPDDRS